MYLCLLVRGPGSKARGLGKALWQPSSSTSHCHGRQLNYAGATPRHVCRAMAAMAPTGTGTGTPKTVAQILVHAWMGPRRGRQIPSTASAHGM